MARFRTIELQTTFYHPPANKVAERWKALAPASFCFCMKAWQLITHTPSSPTYRRLKAGISEAEKDSYGSFRPTEQVALAWERTREIAAIVDAQMIVFQCPASFTPTRENIRNLNTFFSGIDRDGRKLAWEPRGEAWSDDLIRQLCARNQLIHCVDPFVRHSVYGEMVYWRLHGRGGYRYRYTDAELDELHGKFQAADLGGFVMFNNMASLEDAGRFIARQPR